MATGFLWSFVNYTGIDVSLSVGGFYNTGDITPINSVSLTSTAIGPDYFESSNSSFAAMTATFNVSYGNNQTSTATGTLLMIPSSMISTTNGSGFVVGSMTPTVLTNFGTIIMNVNQNYTGDWGLGTVQLFRVPGSY